VLVVVLPLLTIVRAVSPWFSRRVLLGDQRQRCVLEFAAPVACRRSEDCVVPRRFGRLDVGVCPAASNLVCTGENRTARGRDSRHRAQLPLAEPDSSIRAMTSALLRRSDASQILMSWMPRRLILDLDRRADFQRENVCVRVCRSPEVLDPGAVVPAAIESPISPPAGKR